MGSSNLVNIKTQQPMAEGKRSIKSFLKKPFQALFQKDKHRKEKAKDAKETKDIKDVEVIIKPEPVKITPVSVLLENFEKLKIESKADKEDEDDEFKNFTFKIIEEDSRGPRKDSNVSDESGYSEKCIDSEEEQDDKLLDSFNNLSVEDKKNHDHEEEKPKKLQTVVITRGPDRLRVTDLGSAHPYTREQSDSLYRQINQVNIQTFSGGQVIVNSNTKIESCSEIDLALKQVDYNVQKFTLNSEEEIDDHWHIAQEYVIDTAKTENLIEMVINKTIEKLEDTGVNPFISDFNNQTKEPNPVEVFSTIDHTFEYEHDTLVLEDGHVFPTPPHSENMASPMSESLYPSNSDYTSSPVTLSPMYNSDYEYYQDIPSYEDVPTCVTDNIDGGIDKRKPERASMTLKQFKDMQKDIALRFSKKECCQENRKSCKEIFQEHMSKLKVEERKGLCFNVARMDLNAAYGVLQQILVSLSKDASNEDLQLALFSLICEKVLALKPDLFVDDFGLRLLKSAVMRCSHRPLLTRYLVQCIRVVTRGDAYQPTKGHVFLEVDALGDNLLIACARAGDACADVLSELVRVQDKDVPLFDLQHANIDGHTALHVACSEHRARAPRLHVVHVLLQHARDDLWKSDIKGGDTPLHLAVNSANCDLVLIMIIFKHVPRDQWKKLAHAANRSSVTPIQSARSALKSASRPNYPVEVYDFLKKCR